MIRINEITDTLAAHRPDADVALVQKAYVFSAAAHAGQTRLSGEPYLSHPLEVANILAEMRMDEATVAAALLHDTVEDTIAAIEDIDAEFGEEVADIVDGVTKISQITFESKEEAQAENIRKMILAMAEDIRVLLVKLADRLHNMRTLDFQRPEKQARIAQETLDIYAPLANRLGLYRIQVELEDLGLKYTKPDVHGHIEKGVKRHQTTGRDYIIKVTGELKAILKRNRIKGRVNGRTKHINSIYRKMVAQNLALEEVHDIIAFRIIVASVKDCYAVLGVVHSMWRPVPGRFKDYISMPKANMYQSLHTTVIGPDGERIEIQIRTEEMHQLAEHGVASHWLYKSGGRMKAKEVEQFSWLRRILDWQKEELDAKEFMNSLRFDLFKDEVYVFTPRGQVKELPEGATPVDFAYLIHTDIGDHCNGAKVGGKLVPLSTALKNGDVVEIITDPNRKPSRDWLKFVKTAKARTRINHYIRTEERERSIALGREMLEKEGRKMGLNFGRLAKAGEFGALAEEFSFKSAEDLYSSVGYSRITPRKVLGKLLPKDAAYRESRRAETADAQAQAQAKSGGKGSDHVSISGVDDVLVRFANCCNPVPGDHIVGYISRGKGVTVHRSDCPNLGGLETERLLSVTWDAGKAETQAPARPYKTRIRIITVNERGVLAAVSGTLAEEGVNVDAGRFGSHEDGTTDMSFTVEVRDSKHLYEAIDRLTDLDTVLEVTRMAELEMVDSDEPDEAEHGAGPDAEGPASAPAGATGGAAPRATRAVEAVAK